MNYNWNFGIVLKEFPVMLKGLMLGLGLAIVALFIGMIIGLFMSFLAVSKEKLFQKIARGYVTILRNTPLLVLIYIVYFGLPDLKISMGKQESFIFALSIYAGAYMTEVFRAGLEAIPKGLIEAGQAIGLNFFQIRWCIQLPIMFRNVLPSLGNYLISLFKDTSLAASITIAELTYCARRLNTLTFRVFEVWIITAILYVITCYLIAFILHKLEKKLTIA